MNGLTRFPLSLLSPCFSLLFFSLLRDDSQRPSLPSSGPPSWLSEPISGSHVMPDPHLVPSLPSQPPYCSPSPASPSSNPRFTFPPTLQNSVLPPLTSDPTLPLPDLRPQLSAGAPPPTSAASPAIRQQREIIPPPYPLFSSSTACSQPPNGSSSVHQPHLPSAPPLPQDHLSQHLTLSPPPPLPPSSPPLPSASAHPGHFKPYSTRPPPVRHNASFQAPAATTVNNALVPSSSPAPPSLAAFPPLPSGSPCLTPPAAPTSTQLPILPNPRPPLLQHQSYAQVAKGYRGSGFVRAHASEVDSFARLPRTGINVICGSRDGIPAFSFVHSDLPIVEGLYAKALVMKFLRGRPSLAASHKEISSWGIDSPFSIGPLTSRSFLLRFQDERDLLKILTRPSSSLITFSYKIFRWHSRCHIDEDSCMAPVWISLPRLPLQCFAPEFLETIANKIGRFLCFDKATATLARPSAARMCVEIDLRKARPQFIWIGLFEGLKQLVVYEKVPKFCRGCNMQGHTSVECSKIILDNYQPLASDRIPAVHNRSQDVRRNAKETFPADSRGLKSINPSHDVAPLIPSMSIAVEAVPSSSVNPHLPTPHNVSAAHSTQTTVPPPPEPSPLVPGVEPLQDPAHQPPPPAPIAVQPQAPKGNSQSLSERTPPVRQNAVGSIQQHPAESHLPPDDSIQSQSSNPSNPIPVAINPADNLAAAAHLSSFITPSLSGVQHTLLPQPDAVLLPHMPQAEAPVDQSISSMVPSASPTPPSTSTTFAPATMSSPAPPQMSSSIDASATLPSSSSPITATATILASPVSAKASHHPSLPPMHTSETDAQTNRDQPAHTDPFSPSAAAPTMPQKSTSKNQHPPSTSTIHSNFEGHNVVCLMPHQSHPNRAIWETITKQFALRNQPFTSTYEMDPSAAVAHEAHNQLPNNPGSSFSPEESDSEVSASEESGHNVGTITGHFSDHAFYERPQNFKKNKRHPDGPLKVQLRARKGQSSNRR